MNRLLIALPLTALLAGCATQDGSTLLGAATGAAIGTAVADDGDELQGAVIGGVAGAAAGSLIGRNANGECVYRRSDGSTFIGPC
ncbi:MAG: glycine zipper 2TM domain-containing protein [Pseudomonadota bacterium]